MALVRSALICTRTGTSTPLIWKISEPCLDDLAGLRLATLEGVAAAVGEECRIWSAMW